MNKVFDEIAAERNRQTEKYGEQKVTAVAVQIIEYMDRKIKEQENG